MILASGEKRVFRLLLIDDNPHGLTVRKSILVERGYTVTTATSGEEGMSCFESAFTEQPFDLVVTDYRMPGIRGEELVRRVKLMSPKLPVIMLSGYAALLELTPESTGADIILPKGPHEQHELVRAIESLLPASLLPRPKQSPGERKSASGVAHSAGRRRTGS